MKLKDLTPEQKIKLLAELDDVKVFQVPQHTDPGFQIIINTGILPKGAVELTASEWPTHWVGQKHYLTSYDASIPLAQKLGLWHKVLEHYQNTPPTPSQIADFILVEKGKAEL